MLIASVTIIFILFWLLRGELRKLQLAWNIKGPKALPLIGNGLDLINKTPPEFIQIIHGYLKNHGKFLRIWLGNQLLIMMTDPKDVQAILTNVKLITKSQEYKFLEPWLKTGLLTSTNQKWMTRRKIMTPAFHFKILDEFVEVFDKCSLILVEKLKKHDGGKAFNAFPLVALCALDVICGNKCSI